MAERANLDLPRYDQSNFSGRAKHFFVVTNPLNLFTSSETLDKAKDLVTQYRNNAEPAGTPIDEVWKAKYLQDSAFHPDTGEKVTLVGRMSAQVPCNMLITGCMMTFYKTIPAVVGWQWLNQTFNSIVNFSNRSGDKPISNSQLGISYFLATASATGTALGLNKVTKSLPPLVGRYVPFAAVAAANCINVPFMRNKEISNGVPIFDKNGEHIGDSTAAAKKGITQVVISRIFMAMPGMAIPPLVMNKLEKGGFWKKYPKAAAPVQVGLVGLMLVFATPLCCAIFPQKSSIAASKLENELQVKLNPTQLGETFYFNKGL